LIKRPGDLSGAHRILQRDLELGRFLEHLSPVNVVQGTKVTDNLLSGSQVAKALNCYATNGSARKQDGYFPINIEQAQNFRKVLADAEVIKICTVLYTAHSITKIKATLRAEFKKDFAIKVICGRDITDDAFFGSSQRIGESDKESIRNMLKNENTMLRLRTLLDVSETARKFVFNSDEQIDNTNLVTRYKSLPKKCFPFLSMGLRHDSTCHPFVRVRETYAIDREAKEVREQTQKLDLVGA
jgi:hypothetical protein